MDCKSSVIFTVSGGRGLAFGAGSAWQVESLNSPVASCNRRWGVSALGTTLGKEIREPEYRSPALHERLAILHCPGRIQDRHAATARRCGARRRQPRECSRGGLIQLVGPCRGRHVRCSNRGAYDGNAFHFERCGSRIWALSSVGL